MKKIFLSFLFVSLLVIAMANESYSAPVIFFSDLTDAPISGWQGSTTTGAAVSIWGMNFGTTRGTSYVTVCGQQIKTDSSFAEWGATSTPKTARGLQRITFWLNSAMIVGASGISVTNSDGTSNIIPFYCRNSGFIYFESRLDGNDSYDGLADHFVSGTHGPWLRATKIRTTLKAGDVVYLRGNGTAIWNEDDGNSSIVYFAGSGSPGQEHNNGTSNNSITVASYPGEVAQWGDASRGTVIRHSYGDTLNYWTFAKMITRSNGDSTYWMQQPPTADADDHIRFVGLDMSTYQDSSVLVASAGNNGLGGTGTTNLSILGNYIHDAGNAGGSHNPCPLLPTQRYGIYLAGYGSQTHVEIGWNEVAWSCRGTGVQIYGHLIGDHIDDLRIHDNYIHDNSKYGLEGGGGDGGGVYNFVGTEYIWNNIIANNGNNTANDGPLSVYPNLNVGGVGGGGSGGTFYVWNNTLYKGYSGEMQINNMNTPNVTATVENNIIYSSYQSYALGTNYTASGDHNLFFGTGINKPSWDISTLLNVDPQFVNLNPVSYADFQIQSGSKAIATGTNAGLIQTYIKQDFYGVPVPGGTGGLYSIGVSAKTPKKPNPPILGIVK